jgi:hypothetical protein
MIRDLFVAALGALIISEVTDISPWLAVHLVRWAADHIYAAGSDRAAIRQEEWEALVRDELPTRTSKLFFGLAFGCAALSCLLIRCAPKALAVIRRLLRRCVPSGDTVTSWVTALVAVIIWNLQGIYGIIAWCFLGALFVLWIGTIVLLSVMEAVKARRLRKAAT